MPLSFTCSTPGTNSDYIKYLYGSPQRTHQKGGAILLDFSLAPHDSAFVPLTRGSYITFDTATYSKWFTGYVTSDPERVYIGTKVGAPAWAYKIQATSDDYILNLRTIGIIPVFVGVTMGDVIKALADLLAPGVFDVTNVADGPRLATYTITPDKKFSDVVKDFCDSANFVLWANDKKLYFKKQDYVSSTLLIDGADKHFTPSNLTIKPTTNQIVNDVVVLGDVEPEAYVTEYLTGNGFDGSFPLLTGVYGADNYVLINETFGSSAFNAQTWTPYDNSNNWLQVYNGYLNVLGGTANNSLDISLQSKYPIPLEGTLRITHGEWDFLPAVANGTFEGILGGLWSQAPNGSLTGLVYGLKFQKDAFANYVLTPVINGVEDGTQYVTPDTTGAKRYVIRTIATYNRLHKTTQQFNYRDIAGVVHTIGDGSDLPDTGYYQTYLSEIDVTTGLLTGSWKWENDGITVTPIYATYVPVAANNLHCTVSGISISVPLQASLDRAKVVPMANNNFDNWHDTSFPDLWNYVNSAVQENTDVVSGSAMKLVSTTPGGNTAFVERLVSTYLSPGKKYLLSCSVKRSSGFTGGFTIDLNDPSSTVTPSAGVYTPYTGISASEYTQVYGVLTTPLVGALPDVLVLRVYITDNTSTPVGSTLLVDDLVIYEDWESLVIGPNDIDSLDGNTTTATIVGGNNTPQTTTLTGIPTYSPGAASLVFFKDTALQSSTTPQPNELYRLTYRAAANCYGRAQNKDSIAAEAALWGDTGIRSAIKQDFKPRPRNAAECEAVAASFVGEDGYQHYDGSYTVWSQYSGGHPIAGTVVKFQNLPAGMPPVQAEEINSVVTTFASSKPVERFSHAVTFGYPDIIQQTLAGLSEDKGSFAEYVSSQQSVTQVIDFSSAGLAHAPDVVEPVIVAWDSANITIDCNQTPPTGGGFEVRSSDSGWGSDDGNNLITRLTGGATTFSIPRQDKTKVAFIKAFDVRNLLLYSEGTITGPHYATDNPGSVTWSMSRKVDPDGKYANVTTVSMLAGGYDFYSSGASGAFSGRVVTGSISVRGVGSSVGKTITIVFSNGAVLFGSRTFTLSSGWQRYTITATAPSGSSGVLLAIFSTTAAVVLDVTRFSLEADTSVETAYCKTLATAYGATSRYAAALRVAFPPTNGPVGAFVNATLEVDTLNISQIISPPSQVVTVTASSVIVPDALVKSIRSTADVTLTTLPVINGGVNGQQLTLLNTGAFNITIPCASTLSGSTVATANDIVLGSNGMFQLMYLYGTGWIQSAGSGSAYGISGYTITRYI